MKYLLYILIVLFGAGAVAFVGVVGQDRRALAECNEWAIDVALSPQHVSGYDQWQIDQCAFYKINLVEATATSTVSEATTSDTH